MRTKSKLLLQRPPADFDEVKRRFIRQNRDLAKNNSNQSLRIRSLELEVSRLQADNLDLRERILQLQNELDGARAGQLPGDPIRRVREELQAKLAELSGLVDSLNVVAHDTDENVTSELRRDKRPLEGLWRERQPLTEAMRENQMPTIAEDKQYPRQTLGAEEISTIRLADQGRNESPDLGPPPVARFDYEDPVKQWPLLTTQPASQIGEADELSASLLVNLENRQRRNGSGPELETRQHSVVSQSPTRTDVELPTMLRTGAKRKLADRDLGKPFKPPGTGDFTFSRKSVASEAKSRPGQRSPEVVDLASKTVVDIIQDVSATPPRSVRRVLGDKSVNMSPRKLSATSILDNMDRETIEKPEKPTAPRSASAVRKRRVTTVPQPLPPDDIVTTIEIPSSAMSPYLSVPPETPAPKNLFSPTPSETLAARPATDGQARAGTPPPSELSTPNIATDGIGGMRPSRRARVAINYTEPSLNAKIRRPGKGMVDAVTGLVDPRRAMSGSATERKPRAVVVKKEPVEDDLAEEEAWRNLPPRTSADVAARPLAPNSVDSSSDNYSLNTPLENESVSHQSDHNLSAASATISALMAGGRRRRRDTVQSLPQEDLGSDIAAKMEELNVYDFTGSSSPAGCSHDVLSGQGGVGKSQAIASRRRHSSVVKSPPDGLELEGRSAEADRPQSAVASFAGGERGSSSKLERAANRRRSMML